jgi:hypothetical protein
VTILTNTDLYHADFATWCEQTAALLRAGQWPEIDLEALAEEVESLARSQRRELANRLTVLVLHLLKWQVQPQRRELGHSWASTIQTQRDALATLLDENPSLARQVGEVLEHSYPRARQRAIEEMSPGWPRLRVVVSQPQPQPPAPPPTCPWTARQVLDLDFWP